MVTCIAMLSSLAMADMPQKNSAWYQTAVLIATGSVLGLLFGYLVSSTISGFITDRTDILVKVWLSWPEFHLVAAFFSLTVYLALLPASIAFRQSVVSDLRAA